MTDKTNFGKYIRELRLTRGVSKVDLCEGICGKVTYQYYEDGSCYPPLLIRKRLLDRLGASEDNRIVLVDSDEYQRCTEYFELIDCIEDKDINECYYLLSDIRESVANLKGKEKQVAEQMLIGAEAEIKRVLEKNVDSQIYKRILDYSIKNFEIGSANKLKRSILSSEEYYYLLMYYIYIWKEMKANKEYENKENVLKDVIILMKMIDNAFLSEEIKEKFISSLKWLYGEVHDHSNENINCECEQADYIMKETVINLGNIHKSPKIVCDIDFIKNKMDELSCTPEKLSECGVSVRELKRILTKKAKPTRMTMKMILEYFENVD